MNLHKMSVRAELGDFHKRDLLVNLIHAGVSSIGGESAHTNTGAAKQATKELVKMSD